MPVIEVHLIHCDCGCDHSYLREILIDGKPAEGEVTFDTLHGNYSNLDEVKCPRCGEAEPVMGPRVRNPQGLDERELFYCGACHASFAFDDENNPILTPDPI